MRISTWAEDAELPEPNPLEDENRRLRQTVEQQQGTIEQLQGVLRCAAKVLLPYIRAAGR